MLTKIPNIHIHRMSILTSNNPMILVQRFVTRTHFRMKFMRYTVEGTVFRSVTHVESIMGTCFPPVVHTAYIIGACSPPVIHAAKSRARAYHHTQICHES